MLKNYIKTSFRYLYNNKAFTVINITGLSTGICVCFFALLYVQFELGRDSYNKQEANIYRLVTDVKTPLATNYESAPAPMGPAVAAAFPGVKAMARVFMDDMIIQSTPDNAGKEEIAYADATVFSIFTWPLLRGNAAHVFDAPYNVVLSAGAAKKYFGKNDPIGKTMLLNGTQKATVTGIMQDIPYNSHLRVDMLFSISTLVNQGLDQNWTYFGFYTYLLLQPGADAEKLRHGLPAFINSHIHQPGTTYQVSLEPLKNVYLYGKPRGHRTGSSESGSITNIYIFSVVAAFVLFIACFNFINLTTAFSLKRAKEVAVRKVIGATKKQLVAQFFMDAVLLCLIAFVISLFLAAVLLPVFNQLAGTIIITGLFQHLNYLVWLFMIAVTVGLLSGIYPALFLSGFKPLGALKGGFNPGNGGLLLRRSLVVAQFAISTVLIIATAVVYNQVDFMQNQQLGFKKEHQLVIDFQFDGHIGNHTDAVKQQLNAIPGVNGASFSLNIPGMPNNRYLTTIQNKDNVNQQLMSDAYFVDDDFLKQYDIKLAAGRGFSKQYSTDKTQAMLINEAMAKKLGYTYAAEAIGKPYKQGRGADHGNIIGVVKDFHFHSFAEAIQPLTIRWGDGYYTCNTISVASGHIQRTISRIEGKYKELAPGLPFIYYFADEAYNRQYLAQQRFGRLFVCFSVLAILISCLGLLGLSAFSTAQRKKEIGIRKVLGASAASIAALLSKDFARLVIISLLIASPAAWWLMHLWLQNFAYHIQISAWVFIISGTSALIIALLTVSFQSVKAAIGSPVKNLRAE